jgi:hypothetical protein
MRPTAHQPLITSDGQASTATRSSGGDGGEVCSSTHFDESPIDEEEELRLESDKTWEVMELQWRDNIVGW